ncbi:uncharacterized protein LOC115041449 [Echeneis naucrates]|uniref:Uncharacterized LOC115041449 n=1 Tax=Echeneis naucrates TaxID=173247 RepID=A0A665WT75_ECHNA|nr:uncharacterized protein LOC115041449 [Echeneis naucrates]
MMESSHSRCFLLLLLICSVAFGLASVVYRHYFFYHILSTWMEAQSHCRRLGDNTDLATIYVDSDKDYITVHGPYAWIGLHLKEEKDPRPWLGSENSFPVFGCENNELQDDECIYSLYAHRRYGCSKCGDYNFVICQVLVNQTHKYKFIPQSKTWLEAQQYCMSHYQDPIQNLADQSGLDLQEFPVWTGLYRNGTSWMWSTGFREFKRWVPDEQSHNGDCVSISSISKDMSTQDCSARFPFACYRDNLVLVKENKTWEEALEHCRSLSAYISYELVSVEPGTDNTFLKNRIRSADTEEVWTGLRFLNGRWLWVNGAEMLYTDQPDCPVLGQSCGVLSKSITVRMKARDCTEARNFLCYTKFI